MRETIAHVILELVVILLFAALVVAAALVFASSRAMAQEVDEATKILALKRAYQINGNSMVGPTIDLTGEVPGSIPVVTEKVRNTVAAMKDDPPPAKDICARHGLRKVIKGDSWKCRK
jgi:hypothetical protein